VVLLTPASDHHHQPGAFEDGEVLAGRLPGQACRCGQLGERETAPGEQGVEEEPSRGVRQGREHGLVVRHAPKIGN
jgi:hypothetical protein